MADEPISALTQIAAPTGTPPYPTAFTNPSTGAMLELLDTTNTSMASTGTNSRIAPGDLLKGFLAAGSNVTLTETSGIVTVAASGGSPGGSSGQIQTNNGSGGFAALAVPLPASSGGTGLTAPAFATNETIALTGNLFIPVTTLGNLSTDTYITLPNAGTYLIWSNIQVNMYLTGGLAGNVVAASAQLYDSTNSVVVPNTPVNVFILGLQATITVSYLQFQALGTIAPVIYTVTGATNIHIQGCYLSLQESAASNAVTFESGGNAPFFTNGTFLTAMRLY